MALWDLWPTEPRTLEFGHVDFWPMMGQELQRGVKMGKNGNFATYRGRNSTKRDLTSAQGISYCRISPPIRGEVLRYEISWAKVEQYQVLHPLVISPPGKMN